MRETPISGSDQSGVRNERGFDFGRALRHPHGKHERLLGPFFPRLTKIVGIRITIAMSSPKHECCVADDEARISAVIV